MQLDCAKEIFGNVASASPDKEAFRKSLLPIPLKDIFFIYFKKLKKSSKKTLYELPAKNGQTNNKKNIKNHSHLMLF